MKYEFIKTSDTLILPKEKLIEKLKTSGETELKVLLYASAIASEGGEITENRISELSGLDTTDIISGLQFWRGADVIAVCSKGSEPSAKQNEKTVAPTEKNPPQKDDLPNYSGEEINALFEKNEELRMIIDECQKIAGKIFNPHECNKIVSLYDYVGLSAEYILSVYGYCAKKNKTTVHYVVKTALNIYDEGADTDEKLREYLKNKEIFDSAVTKIRNIFGIGQRALTKKEETLIKKWTESRNFDMDMISYAYELTVDSIGKPSLAYAGKILENWHSADITTTEQAKEAEFKHKQTKDTSTQNNSGLYSSSFDTDEFFEAALKKSYENIGKKPE